MALEATLGRGDLAYYVTVHGGPLPVRVVGPARDGAGDSVRVQTTADRSTWGYPRGEEFDASRAFVYPRQWRYVSSGMFRWHRGTLAFELGEVPRV